MCHVHAFAYFDGVPRMLVPDNLKTGVLDPMLADAICDRIKHRSYVITLKGESMRKLTATVD